MKKKCSLSLLSLIVALPAAAQVVSIGDVSGFREALKGVEAPASPSSRPLEAAAAAGAAAGAARAACAVLSLNGATVGRGLFQNDYTVKVGDQEVGKVASSGSGWTYTAGGASQASVAVSDVQSGRRATVTGCDGETLGSVVETDASGSSRFVITDASGNVVAYSGDVDGTTWSMTGSGASASIKNDHWLLDRYALTMSGVDGRLVLTAAIMNNQALYRRSSQNRPQHEPHGRGDR